LTHVERQCKFPISASQPLIVHRQMVARVQYLAHTYIQVSNSNQIFNVSLFFLFFWNNYPWFLELENSSHLKVIILVYCKNLI
jgi:hypothetical protein